MVFTKIDFCAIVSDEQKIQKKLPTFVNCNEINEILHYFLKIYAPENQNNYIVDEMKARRRSLAQVVVVAIQPKEIIRNVPLHSK